MTIKKLSYSGFRNLEDGIYEPCPQMNILYGNNAQGKTNLIEAMWLFTGSRSFRGSKDSELVRFGCEAVGLAMEYEAAGRNQKIKLTIDGVRKAELNGTPLDSPLRLSGEFCSVIFSPEHLGLVKEGPQLRRKFIDAAICQLSPRHASAVLEFKKALAQRNALLKDIPRHSQLMDTLDTWDDKLCRSGAHIAYTRLRYLKRLEKKACDIYGGIAGSGEKLRLEYLSPEGVDLSCELSDPAAALKSISHELNGAMRRTRALDIESGYTHAGPHRDDLDIYINEKLARSYGSQGQQRSVVLALKLAEAAVLRDSMGEPPVLLLDDVMSELDRSRQDYLLNSIEGMQIFITCCEPTWPAGLRGGSVFEMISGVLKPGVST